MQTKTETEIIQFLKELLHPEGFAWAVTPEVRKHAHEILIMIESESSNEQDSTIRQTV